MCRLSYDRSNKKFLHAIFLKGNTASLYNFPETMILLQKNTCNVCNFPIKNVSVEILNWLT